MRKFFRNITRIMVIGLAMISFLWPGTIAEGQQDNKGRKPVKRTSVVQGEISGITKNYISIVYKRDREKDIEYEMLLPINRKDLQIEHKRNLDEFKVGDTVILTYEDTVTGDNEKEQGMKRKAMVIRFVKSAPPKPPGQEE